MVCDSEHIVTLLASYLSIDFRDGGASNFGVVLISRNIFDNDFNAKGVVLCNDNFSFLTTLNLTFDCILFNLGIVSLCLQDGIDKGLAFLW